MTDTALTNAAKCRALWAKFEAFAKSEPRGAPNIINGMKETPEHARWWRAQKKACDDWNAAYGVVAKTKPTTREGAVALIDAFLEWEGGYEDEEIEALLGNLRAFLAAS